jgi:hypothetical protein
VATTRPDAIAVVKQAPGAPSLARSPALQPHNSISWFTARDLSGEKVIDLFPKERAENSISPWKCDNVRLGCQHSVKKELLPDESMHRLSASAGLYGSAASQWTGCTVNNAIDELNRLSEALSCSAEC